MGDENLSGNLNQRVFNPTDDLWVVSVGINDYTDSYFPNLLFAINDAQNLGNVLKAQEGLAFKSVNSRVLTGPDATKENILSDLEFLQDAKEDDTVILFFALHRIVQNDGFYFMTSDSTYKPEADDTESVASLINFDDIIAALDFHAKKIIILDTHYPKGSGLSEELEIAIFSACRENEQARESHQLGGGVFTSSIIEAFKYAGVNGDVTLESINEYVIDRVRSLTDRRQSPVLHAPADMKKMVLGIIN